MLEIEQKYARPDFDSITRKLLGWNASGPEVHEEVDHYFNAPDRDFARTGEAFRLRQIGPKNFFTFKGPKRQAAVKIRTELEIPLPDGDEAARQHAELLGQLGYRAVAVVRKRRSSYSLNREGLSVTVCLDEVEELGRFAEVEVLAGDDRAKEAEGVLQRLAAEVGLVEVAPRAYLTMLLQARAAQPSRRAEPQVVRTVEELRAALAEPRRQRMSVGLAPTMGALHAGHLSLIESARGRNDFVVVSIFVNPTQFGPNEDLSRYPRTFEEDLKLCAAAGVDLIFHPALEVMYPEGFHTFVEVTGLQDVLEGEARPGHFRGVATVVLKLFNLVAPDRAYFGQKDAQQAVIIKRMVLDLALPVEVVVCPTVREADGLALSSRNRYLDSRQREQATVLSRALNRAGELFRSGQRDAVALLREIEKTVASAAEAKLEHAAVVDPETLQPLEHIDRAALVVMAVRFGSTRLIDNIRLEG